MSTNFDMNGKICFVTGTTTGIGKVTAKELAKIGATVVMLCRNRAKGEAVKAEIQKSNSGAAVDLIVADLSSLHDVRRAADEFKTKYSRLDVLINNAGGVNYERKVTADGLETTFEANYLSHFLLTELLLDLLEASAPARIINVSSAVHALGRIDFDDLQCEHRYTWMSAYSQAKLAQIYFTYELAERLKGTGVTANALHPGLVSSNFNSNTEGIVHVITGLVYAVAGINAEEGAKTSIYLAGSPEVEGVTGKYFYKCRQKASSKASYDLSIRRRLWDISEELARQKEGT